MMNEHAKGHRRAAFLSGRLNELRRDLRRPTAKPSMR